MYGMVFKTKSSLFGNNPGKLVIKIKQVFNATNGTMKIQILMDFVLLISFINKL